MVSQSRNPFEPNMLLPNNPELDPRTISEKLEKISSHRRRPKPLFVKSTAASSSISLSVEEAPQSTGIRGLIKRIPLVGSITLEMYRRFRRMTAPGLHWKERLVLIPILGPSLLWINGIVRLNAIRQQIAQELLELRHMQHFQQLNHINTSDRLDRFDRIDIASRLDRFDALDISNRLDELDALMRSARMHKIEQDNRIAGLIQELRSYIQTSPDMRARSDATAAASASQPMASTIDLDNFYLEFEGQFRGSREDILSRLKVYLPYLTNLAGNGNARVIDIGCGRGEWLELLAEQGINATGIDLNQAMVNSCRERGFLAECADAIAYLRQQPEGSLAAVTGFHIIEHLSFETLIALFDAALRALNKDGLIIFETPNPENLVVGSCNFYYDPTHQHPIVPVVAEFIARQRGFARAEILRLHPFPENLQLTEDSEIARRFNRAMYGSQDYAVLAWKTHAN